MKNVKVIGWASLLFLIIFSSCREDIIDPITKINTPDPIVLVTANVQGQVYDEDMNLLEGVSVKMGDDILITDQNGEFRFTDKSMNKNGTYLTATNDGYFLGAKMINPELSATSFVVFQLLKKELSGTFMSENGGTIQTPDGASVVFGGNSIMYENGSPYTGEVQVYAKWLNPDNSSITEQMPGDLRAIDSEDDLVQLATFGMIAVELETASGQALQISEGNTATITLPVAPSQANTAPNEIPLWSFDEEIGYWIEESTASLSNNQYVGEVSHFSFWNCDAPFPLVIVNGSVKYTSGLSASNYSVIVSMASNSAITSSGQTNSNGNYGGKMPKDELLNIIVENNCGDEVYTGQAGPFSANGTIADIVISDNDLVILSGFLLNCDGTPSTNGYVSIIGEGNNITAYTESDGSFQAAVNLCEDGIITVQGFDIDNLKTGPDQTIDASASGGTFDLGNLSLCEAIDEYISIEMTEIDYSFLHITYNATNAAQFSLNAGTGQDSSYFQINSEEITATGIYDVGYFNYTDGNFTSNGMDWGVYLGCGNGSTFTCPQLEVTLFEGSGGYMEGNFSGTVEVYESPNFSQIDIDLDFRIILP